MICRHRHLPRSAKLLAHIAGHQDRDMMRQILAVEHFDKTSRVSIFASVTVFNFCLWNQKQAIARLGSVDLIFLRRAMAAYYLS